MGKIQTCQDRIIALLNADAFFMTGGNIIVPVVGRVTGEHDSERAEKLLSSGVGLAVILRNAKLLEVGTPTLPTTLQFALTAVVNPTLAIPNNLPTAYDIVEHAAKVVQWQFNGVSTPDETLTSRFSCDPQLITPRADPKRPNLDVQVLLVNTTVELST